MNTPKAFLFDLNGTMIDDMAYHTQAWHNILNNDLGLTISLDEVKQHMYGKNRELIIRLFGEGKYSEEAIEKFSNEKEQRYRESFKPHLKLLPGLQRFLEQAFAKAIPMAIGSAAITANIDFVLDGLNIRKFIAAVVSADDVKNSKPDPETFLLAAQKLGINPADCIVFEDNPKGVEAALNAGMKCIVLTTMHQEHEFANLNNILFFASDYTNPKFADCL